MPTDPRWFGRGPAVGLLRSRETAQQTSYVELFFDLIMVFALNRLVAFAVQGAGTPDSTIRWISVARILLLLAALVWAWTITAYITARLDPTAPGTQSSVLLTAFALLVMGTSLTNAFDGGALVFAMSYVFAQTARVLFLGWVLKTHPLASVYHRSLAWFGLAAVFWVAGALAGGDAQLSLWAVAVVVEFGSARLGWPIPGRGRQRATAWAVRPHHMAERYQQLLLLALGETLLSVGATFAIGRNRVTATEILGLLVAFLTAVLLWRTYFHRAGLLLADAVATDRDPAQVGRFAGSAHVVMIAGIVATSIGHGIVQSRPVGHSYPAWLAMMLGGPAGFLLGRAALERAVFARISPRRWVGIAVMLAAGPPLLSAPPLVPAATAAVVLFGIAVADTRQAARRPGEQPKPADGNATWLWRPHGRPD